MRFPCLLLSLAVLLPAVFCDITPESEGNVAEPKVAELSTGKSTEDTLSSDVRGDLNSKSIIDFIKAHGEMIFGKQKNSNLINADRDSSKDLHQSHQQMFGPSHEKESKPNNAIVHFRLSHVVREHSLKRIPRAFNQESDSDSSSSEEEDKMKEENKSTVDEEEPEEVEILKDIEEPKEYEEPKVEDIETDNEVFLPIDNKDLKENVEPKVDDVVMDNEVHLPKDNKDLKEYKVPIDNEEPKVGEVPMDKEEPKDYEEPKDEMDFNMDY